MKKIKFIILILIAISIRTFAQIPNNGFENWTSIGNYYNPNSWSCLNDKTASKSIYTCERGAPGNPGNYYLKLTSKNITGLGVVPGISVSGTINQTTLQPLTGFAFNQRPASLKGSWQYMGFGSSEGYVDIKLSRWDSSMQMRMPVASAHHILTGMEMNWVNFTIPLSYVDANKPDSCIIVLSASGNSPTDGDFLYVDNLAFSGTVGIRDNTNSISSLNIYPNPASRNIMVDLAALKNSRIDFQIYNMVGNIVKTVNGIDVSKTMLIDISEFSKGIYILKIKTDKDNFESHFIKE